MIDTLLVPLVLKLVGDDPKRLAWIAGLFVVIFVGETIASLLCAKWGMSYRGILSRVMTRAENSNALDSEVIKGAFKSEFPDGEKSLAKAGVDALVNEVDPKKTPEPKSKRFGRFLRLVVGGMIGR